MTQDFWVLHGKNKCGVSEEKGFTMNLSKSVWLKGDEAFFRFIRRVSPTDYACAIRNRHEIGRQTAVITGASGFIGKALAKRLDELGYNLILVDKLFGTDAIEWFESNKRLRDVDVVFHLAAQTSVFNEDKEMIIYDNITTFQRVCDICAERGVKLVYASSSTANPCNMTSLYGISKQFNEAYARCYHPKATGVRFHNVYGPNPRPGTLLWYLLNQKRVKLYNEGLNKRHFTYIDDIIEGLLFASMCSHSLINVANPEEISTRVFAERLKKYKDVEIELVKDERNFDRKTQDVNESIYTLNLQYTSVAEGFKRIFVDSRKK